MERGRGSGNGGNTEKKVSAGRTAFWYTCKYGQSCNYIQQSRPIQRGRSISCQNLVETEYSILYCFGQRNLQNIGKFWSGTYHFYHKVQAEPAPLFGHCLGNIWNVFHFFPCFISLLFPSCLIILFYYLFHYLPRLILFISCCNFFAISFLPSLISFPPWQAVRTIIRCYCTIDDKWPKPWQLFPDWNWVFGG